MNGLLISYDYCTGCHSCEIACKKHHGLDEGEFGIVINEIGPVKNKSGRNAGKWEWTYAPALTKECDLCADRTAEGKMPMCVQHCQAWCMAYGDIDELKEKIDPNSRYAFLTPVRA